MKSMRLWPVALAAGLLLSACGGGDGNQSPQTQYAKLVSFGDSLSDVGTYAVSGVAASGGGKYTVNGPQARIWIELLASQLKLDAPCAAQTGLNANEALIGFPAVPVTNHSGCYAYGQGGSRVTNPIGPANAALLALGDASGALGQLTDPLVNQIGRHLAASGGKFGGDELVTTMAGGNDLFMNLAVLAATVGAGGDPAQATAAAVQAMGQAGGELAAYIKTMMIANGAKRVVVVNVPDVSLTPFGKSLDAQTQGVVRLMASTFNTQLASDLSGVAEVLLVDAFTVSQDQTAHPAQYGLANVTDMACAEAVPSSLFCTGQTVVAADVSRYQYADSVHPTPYGYQLLTQLVAKEMAKKGWL
jgi:outer membrane lipase/esterase